MVEYEKIKSLPSGELIEKLIKTAMAVNDLSKNDHAPQSAKKERKSDLQVLKAEVLNRLEQKQVLCTQSP